MDRQVLLRKIMDAGDDIRRLEQDMIALQSIDIVCYPENYSSLSHQAVIKSEYITRKLRELVYSTTNKDWPELLKASANDMGITINSGSGGAVDITIPCLVPGRKKKPTEYITAPLYAALERFVEDRQFERFGRCVIWISADIKSLTENTTREKLLALKPQTNCMGKVTDVRGGVVFINLLDGVRAISHKCFDRRKPGLGDDVLFVCTRIDEEGGVAIGIISRIVKRNI